MAVRRKVLVFGDDSRAFLSVVRSLGRRGLEVHVCPSDHSSPALSSRYIARRHRLPPYDLDATAWTTAVAGLIAREGFALLVPCDDRSILPLHRHPEATGRDGSRVALPNEEAFDAFFDKIATRALAARAGAPTAAGEALDAGSAAPDLAARYGLPLALKPRRSFSLDRVAVRRSVRIVKTEAELAAALAALERPEDHFVEAFFAGDGVGVSVLAARGAVVQAFQHHRVAESDPTGGSTYRVAAALDPRLLAAVEAMAAAAALHGVAMFEFRQDMATGAAVLLEVNARFWGSLPLAVAAGVDFPAQLYDLLVEDRTHPRAAYRVGLYGRSLANDAYRLARLLGDRSLPPAARLGRAAGDVAVGLGRTLAGRERQDTFARDDLRPWLGEWREIGGWLAGGASRRLPLVARARAAARRRRFRERLAPEPGRRRRILAVCFGNICRTPVAEALLAARLRSARPDVEVASAGFFAHEGRRSPDTAVAEAARLGVDLAGHRSRYARDEDLEGADVILLFDANNLAELQRRGLPGAAGRVVMLGDFDDPPGAEIADPYGHPAGTYRATYARIARCVEAAAASLGAAGRAG